MRSHNPRPILYHPGLPASAAQRVRFSLDLAAILPYVRMLRASEKLLRRGRPGGFLGYRLSLRDGLDSVTVLRVVMVAAACFDVNRIPAD